MPINICWSEGSGVGVEPIPRATPPTGRRQIRMGDIDATIKACHDHAAAGKAGSPERLGTYGGNIVARFSRDGQCHWRRR